MVNLVFTKHSNLIFFLVCLIFTTASPFAIYFHNCHVDPTSSYNSYPLSSQDVTTVGNSWCIICRRSSLFYLHHEQPTKMNSICSQAANTISVAFFCETSGFSCRLMNSPLFHIKNARRTGMPFWKLGCQLGELWRAVL